MQVNESYKSRSLSLLLSFQVSPEGGVEGRVLDVGDVDEILELLGHVLHGLGRVGDLVLDAGSQGLLDSLEVVGHLTQLVDGVLYLLEGDLLAAAQVHVGEESGD